MKSETPNTMRPSALHRRHFLGLSAGAAVWAAGRAASAQAAAPQRAARRDHPVLVGSRNALAGMQQHYAALVDGAPPLDVAIEVVKIAEADPDDHSVGLGGLPNEDGVVQLDAAVMDGATHNSGAVACIENILHPSEVARLVMERSDHCTLVGRGAYVFARAHGHPHVELLTDAARRIWLHWKETMSDQDDRLPPREKPLPPREKPLPPREEPLPPRKEPKQPKHGSLERGAAEHEVARLDSLLRERQTGTIHCSALSVTGDLACTTTTSGLSWKIPGRVGDSPIVGAGLYCDAEAGSAGATGRGEAAILACGSAMCVELMRQGASPLAAGHEVLRRIVRQTQRMASWQPSLVGADGRPSFDIKFYLLGLDGSFAGVSLTGDGKFAVADPEKGPRLEALAGLPD